MHIIITRKVGRQHAGGESPIRCKGDRRYPRVFAVDDRLPHLARNIVFIPQQIDVRFLGDLGVPMGDQELLELRDGSEISLDDRPSMAA